MTIKDIFRLTDGLKEQLSKLQPLKIEDEERLWKKFRLEWNYNSNHIEGNTLTYGHTELLLFFDKVTGDYSGREIEEMKAHDVAIKFVDELAQDKEHPLTEAFIKQLNKIILVRPFWKEAITADNQPTRRLIEIGDYKKYPNSVRLENGEIFSYASPEETPAMMGELMEFYKVHTASTETHPLWLAAMMHYKFVRIHPFDDGNGRLARLLMNYILLKNGYPPVIIKANDKKEYLTALNKADTGDLESFVIYIGEQLKWSFDLSIKAAKGESVDEIGDLDKKISQLKRSLNSHEEIKVERSNGAINTVITNSIEPLLKLIISKLNKFDVLFSSKEVGFVNKNGKELVSYENKSIIDTLNRSSINFSNRLIFEYNHLYFRKGGKKFNVGVQINVIFHQIVYEITGSGLIKPINKLYNEAISQKEIEIISEEIGIYILNLIEKNLENK